MKFFILLMFIIITLFKCTDPTTPPDNCPDTTSHIFTWEVDTLGDRSSYLKDVAIINENNIWAVGEIFVDGEEKMYNAAHWDGTKWTLNKITVRLDYGQTVFYTDQNPMKSIIAFDENDVWFISNAGGVTRFRNENFEMMEIAYGTGPGGANKTWGSSSDNMYFVGSNGNITHYDGANWTRLGSGTDLPIQDIWGGMNKETGETEILAVASERFNNLGNEVLQIEGQLITALPDSGLPWSLSSVWFDPEESYYITGDGVFNKRTLADTSWRELDVPPTIYKDVIRGNNSRDVFIAGSFGILLHYNGSTWKYYNDSEPNIPNCLWLGLAVKEHIVITVGTRDGQAIIVRGYRD